MNPKGPKLWPKIYFFLIFFAEVWLHWQKRQKELVYLMFCCCWVTRFSCWVSMHTTQPPRHRQFKSCFAEWKHVRRAIIFLGSRKKWNYQISIQRKRGMFFSFLQNNSCTIWEILTYKWKSKATKYKSWKLHLKTGIFVKTWAWGQVWGWVQYVNTPNFWSNVYFTRYLISQLWDLFVWNLDSV